jgi:transcriptional regulator with XRE-family HTH domain
MKGRFMNALKLMNASIRKQFGKRLRRLIRMKHVSQKSVAASLGLQPSYFHRVLEGEEFVSNEAIAKLASIFNMTVYQLFEGIETPHVADFALIEESED